MYFIYIIYSEDADRFYVGYTSNMEMRLKQHNEQIDFNTYTRKFRPWKLVALFECGSREKDAISMERFIKKQHSRKLLEKLIDAEFIPAGKLAQLVRVPHLRD